VAVLRALQLGVSGSGKSTPLAFCPLLYDLLEGCGAVLFDSRDVRDYRLADLRRGAALGRSRPVLFEGTIYYNLTYARPGAPKAAVCRALEAADLAGMVEDLPLGLETQVGERGFALSDGQRQRLALAPALISNPAVSCLTTAPPPSMPRARRVSRRPWRSTGRTAPARSSPTGLPQFSMPTGLSFSAADVSWSGVRLTGCWLAAAGMRKRSACRENHY
jgi:ABC-type uncharacterized transport system YnjBCD ATPase subunit